MTDFKKQVNKWKRKGAHFITPIPKMGEIPEFFTAVFEDQTLNGDVIGPDVYSADKAKVNNDWVPDINKCRLRASALQSLSITAGVVWNLQETGMIEQTSNHVIYRAVGGIRKPDGEFVYLSSVYERNMKVFKDQFESQYLSEKAFNFWKNKKWNKDKPKEVFFKEGKLNIERDLRQKRMFLCQMAETGAKNRLISKLLGIKNSYTQKELECPFVAVRIVINYNSKDPDVKKALINGMVNAGNSIYGPPKQISIPEKNTYVPEEITDGEFEDEMEPEGEYVDFLNSSHEDQLKTLEQLSKSKKYDISDYLKRSGKKYSDLSEDTKINLLNHINNMDDDDIPF